MRMQSLNKYIQISPRSDIGWDVLNLSDSLGKKYVAGNKDHGIAKVERVYVAK